MLKWLTGTALTVLLLMYPEAAANGAREAMKQWYCVVAPALFPFMALMPLLTCDAAASVYEYLLGGLTQHIYRLPGAAAPAMVAGMLGGSPAGCLAARRMAAGAGLNRGQLQRLAIGCAGFSPAFLISGIGAGMLGNASLGHVLLRSQLATQISMPLLLMPFCRNREAVEPLKEDVAVGGVGAILNVCGYMALFGAVAGTISCLLGNRAGKMCLMALDINAGASLISALNVPLRVKLLALSGISGFGGLCVCAQNLSVLRDVVRPVAFIAARIAAGCLAAGFTALQTMESPVKYSLDPLRFSCFCVCLLLIPVIFRLKRTIS